VNTHFAPLVPPHEGFSELLPAGFPQDPFSLFLEFPLGHGVAHQLLLQLGEQEVSRGQVRWIGGMLEQFDAFFARNSWTPFTGCTRASSQLRNNSPSSISGIFFYECFRKVLRAPAMKFALGDIVGVHHPPRVEEHQHHRPCRLMACTFAFTGPRVPFLTTVWTAALFCKYALCMDTADYPW